MVQDEQVAEAGPVERSIEERHRGEDLVPRTGPEERLRAAEQTLEEWDADSIRERLMRYGHDYGFAVGSGSGVLVTAAGAASGDPVLTAAGVAMAGGNGAAWVLQPDYPERGEARARHRARDLLHRDDYRLLDRPDWGAMQDLLAATPDVKRMPAAGEPYVRTGETVAEDYMDQSLELNLALDDPDPVQVLAVHDRGVSRGRGRDYELHVFAGGEPYERMVGSSDTAGEYADLGLPLRENWDWFADYLAADYERVESEVID